MAMYQWRGIRGSASCLLFLALIFVTRCFSGGANLVNDPCPRSRARLTVDAERWGATDPVGDTLLVHLQDTFAMLVVVDALGELGNVEAFVACPFDRTGASVRACLSLE